MKKKDFTIGIIIGIFITLFLVFILFTQITFKSNSDFTSYPFTSMEIFLMGFHNVESDNLDSYSSFWNRILTDNHISASYFRVKTNTIGDKSPFEICENNFESQDVNAVRNIKTNKQIFLCFFSRFEGGLEEGFVDCVCYYPTPN